MRLLFLMLRQTLLLLLLIIINKNDRIVADNFVISLYITDRSVYDSRKCNSNICLTYIDCTDHKTAGSSTGQMEQC